jgi:hypothetical protein
VLIALMMAGVALGFANRNSALAVQNAESARIANTQQAIAEEERAKAEAETLTRVAAEGTALQQLNWPAPQFPLAAVNNLSLILLSILLALEAVSITRAAATSAHRGRKPLHRRCRPARPALHSSKDPPPWRIAYSLDGSRLAVSLDDETISCAMPSGRAA